MGDALFKRFDGWMCAIAFVKSPLRYIVNWGRLYSLWPVRLETACYSVEVGAGSRTPRAYQVPLSS